MESTSTLVGLHHGSGPASYSLRARHSRTGGSQARDTTIATTLTTAARSGAKPGTAPWTTRSRAWQAMTVAALVTAAWTFYFIFQKTDGYDGYEAAAIQARILANVLGKAHVWGGGTAMALGPFQFLAGLRRTGKQDTRHSVHSWIGRAYNVCVVAAGVGSLDIVTKSDLEEWGRWGYVVLGSAWAVTALLGWWAILGGAAWGKKANVEGHKRWMTRNFALTYAAVMLRWQFPLLLRYGLTQRLALSISGWLCWVPNILFVELI